MIRYNVAGSQYVSPKFSRTRLAASAQARGWCAEELLFAETKQRERRFRRREKGLKIEARTARLQVPRFCIARTSRPRPHSS